MVSLHHEIDRTCSALKHLDQVDIDLDSVRVVLRRCQRWIELVEETLTDVEVTVQGTTLTRLLEEACE